MSRDDVRAGGDMGRISVVVDQELLARVMKLHGLKTKREAIDFALRRAATTYDPKAILALQGTGWEGDLEMMRRTRNLEI